MNLSIDVSLHYRLPQAATMLVQIEAATNHSGQKVKDAELAIAGYSVLRRITGHRGIGERIWLPGCHELQLSYRAQVLVTRPDPVLAALGNACNEGLSTLPAGIEEYLFPSCYCPLAPFLDLVGERFNAPTDGEKVAAMVEFIAATFTYDPGASTAMTTAADSFAHRAGVCRDYAHVLIAMARAANIPARIASVYAPRAVPPDFHAVAQVWLEGAWRFADPTGMAAAHELAVIGVGRDAADVAFLTTFGIADYVSQSIVVTEN